MITENKNIECSIKPIVILIVEDNRADRRLVEDLLKKGKVLVDLNSAEDGEVAMAYLKKEGQYKDAKTPDLILLDLNMPKKNGFEVLEEMKSDENLKRIPVIVMTISKEDEDVLKSYNLHANAYIVKPVEINQFVEAVKSIENFWLTIVRLPPN
jgi:CheY-like chemotaxis protein